MHKAWKGYVIQPVITVLFYDNIVKISLRTENLSILYAVTRKDYRVKESPLDEHRDVNMHLNSRMSFSR
jgi:hypothetical protein